MSLSNDLISQFAKITNDNSNKKNETTVYGTIVKNGETFYVKIDGADDDTLTPITSTADIKENDRVTVMIKNHRAIITGNLSSPSARIGDVNNISTDVSNIGEEVKAIRADFDKITAGTVTTEDLEAVNAKIEALKTGNNKVLWSGGYYMTSEHTVTLSEAISAQVNGIVLVFSEYYDNAVKNQSFVCRFVPKIVVNSHSGSGHVFGMHTSDLTYFATKYLYISDTNIIGHDNNDKSITGTCGITATNDRFVLRYVMGV